jgi:hypothetical protein
VAATARAKLRPPALTPPPVRAPRSPAPARHATNTGEGACLIISDLDAGVGTWAHTRNTVNTQILQGSLMALCDDPALVSTGQEWAAVRARPVRVPIYVTGAPGWRGRPAGEAAASLAALKKGSTSRRPPTRQPISTQLQRTPRTAPPRDLPPSPSPQPTT